MSDSDVKLKVNYQNRLINLKNIIVTNKIIPQISSIIAAFFILQLYVMQRKRKAQVNKIITIPFL